MVDEIEPWTRGAPTLEFRTARGSGAEQFEAWRTHIAPFFDIEIEREHWAGGVDARQTIANLGSVLIGRTATQSQVFSRSAERIARDGQDHFMVQMFTSGGGAMSHAPVSRGDLLVIDMGQPHHMQNHDFEHLTVLIPRAADPRLTRILERLHGCVIEGSRPLARLLGDHMKAVWAVVPALTAGQAADVTQGLIGLTRGLLAGELAQLDAAPAAVASAIKHAVMEYVEENLHSDLSTDMLMSRFHLSRSMLYRMFAPDGGVLSYVRERRLMRAYRELVTESRFHRSIGELAWACGFSSESHFSRAFRRRFSMSPMEARAERGAAAHAAPDVAHAQSPLGLWLQSLSG